MEGLQVLSFASYSGILGGALHALTGPDHLALLLPCCVGKRWYAGKTGFIWGLGHCIGIMLFGLLSYLVKLVLPFDLNILVKWMDVAIGFSLVAIGVMGIVEVNEEEKKKKAAKKKFDDFEQKANVPKEEKKKILEDPLSLIVTGTIQGFTGTGHFLGIIPAITLPSLVGAMLYLFAFCVGTILAMTAFTAFVGEASRFMVKSGRNTPNQLAMFVSALSVIFGSIYLLWSIMDLFF